MYIFIRNGISVVFSFVCQLHTISLSHCLKMTLGLSQNNFFPKNVTQGLQHRL